MFDFVRLPNPIKRLEFDWVRLVFCSVLFDWIGREEMMLTGEHRVQGVVDISRYISRFTAGKMSILVNLSLYSDINNRHEKIQKSIAVCCQFKREAALQGKNWVGEGKGDEASL